MCIYGSHKSNHVAVPEIKYLNDLANDLNVLDILRIIFANAHIQNV